MKLLPASVRTRLTLWYTIALAVPLAAFAVVSYLIFAATLHGRVDAFLADALSVFSGELAVERGRYPTFEAAVRTTVAEVRFRDLDILVLDPGGRVVATSGTSALARASGDDDAPPDSPGGAADPLSFHDAGPRTVDGPGGAHRVLVTAAPSDDDEYHLVGVYPLADVEETLATIRRLFLTTIPLLIAVAATAGSFLARRSFRPVTQMAARAAEIGASTLHERLPVVTEDELGTLGTVLNELLDRLERSFDQQRRFMADASHELRTPTAIVRTEAEVTLSRRERSADDYRASMEIVHDAARRLTRIVDDIFLLARADAGHLVMHAGPLYLDELVRDTVNTARPIADARGVTIRMHDVGECPARGDADLLGRLVLNLLDNAIKYSPEAGVIDVTLTERSENLELSVVDHGEGIPEQDHDRIFERFYRADTARSRHESTMTSGAGLGLPIGRRIAEMHGGNVSLVGSRPGRTEFRVTLPATPPFSSRT